MSYTCQHCDEIEEKLKHLGELEIAVNRAANTEPYDPAEFRRLSDEYDRFVAETSEWMTVNQEDRCTWISQLRASLTIERLVYPQNAKTLADNYHLRGQFWAANQIEALSKTNQEHEFYSTDYVVIFRRL